MASARSAYALCRDIGYSINPRRLTKPPQETIVKLSDRDTIF